MNKEIKRTSNFRKRYVLFVGQLRSFNCDPRLFPISFNLSICWDSVITSESTVSEGVFRWFFYRVHFVVAGAFLIILSWWWWRSAKNKSPSTVLLWKLHGLPAIFCPICEVQLVLQLCSGQSCSCSWKRLQLCLSANHKRNLIRNISINHRSCLSIALVILVLITRWIRVESELWCLRSSVSHKVDWVDGVGRHCQLIICIDVIYLAASMPRREINEWMNELALPLAITCNSDLLQTITTTVYMSC